MKWISFLLAGLLAISSYGGIETEVAGREGSLVGVALDEIHVQDQWYTYMLLNQSTYGDIFCVNSKKVGVKFWMDREMLTAYAGSWELQITYDILLAKGDGGPTTTYTGETLTLQYDPAAGGNYNDIILKEYNDYMFATLSNMSITYCPGGGACPISAVPDGVHLDAIVTTERFYKLDATEIPVMKRKLLTATNELDLRWNYIEGAESYDLEWVFVDVPTDLFTVDQPFDFRNATRINVPTNHYDLSMAFPRGILVFRVRGRGRNCTTNDEILGTWSYDPTPAQSSTNQVPSLGLGAVPPKWEWDGIELDKNWQYQVAYSEDGKRKEAISFFDGSLRNRESITILNTDDHAIAGQSIYDYLGRPAMQVLPAPMTNQGIKFYGNLTKSSLGVYDYTNFDLNSNIGAPEAFSTASTGAGFYYSALNTAPFGHLGDYVPDAQGHPYTRVRYKNDGTGRISRQTGVGTTLGVGGTHEVEYYYAAPGGQAELDRLFGNEVGFVQQYKKNMVIDPNGQTSVTYVDQNGRTIATALAGDSPTNLQEIDTRPTNANFDEITSDLTDFNTLSQDGQSWELSNTFLVPATGDYTFTYQLDSLNYPACYGDVTCRYDVIFKLQDEDGNYLVDNVFAETSDYQMSNVTKVGTTIRTYTLTPGVYTVTKKVMLTDALLQTAYDNYIVNAPLDTACGVTEPDSITGSDCNPTCTEVCDSTYINYNSSGNWEYLDASYAVLAEVSDNSDPDPANWTYVSGNSGNISTVQGLIDDCKEDCENPTIIPDECQIRYDILKADMTPGGQYFDNLPDVDELTYDENAWLETNLGVNPTGLTGYPWSSSYTTWDLVRSNWDASWADFMTEQHPEYCMWSHFCPGECDEDNGWLNYYYSTDASTVDVTDAEEWYYNPLNMTQVTSTADETTYQPFDTYTDVWTPSLPTIAINEGYLDPLFATGTTDGCRLSLKTSLETYLKDYFDDGTKTYSIWYILKDPDNLHLGTTGSDLEVMIQALHGDGTNAGLLGTGANQVTEFEYFRNAYNFFRELVIYEDFINNVQACPGDPAYCCWLTHDGYGFTTEGFQVRYFENEVFEAFLDGNTETYASDALDAQCDDHCDDMAAQWAQELVDDDCVDAADKSKVEDFFAAICKKGCDVGDIGIGSSSGDGTNVTLHGQSFNNFQQVIDHYSTQCTGCNGDCKSIVYPTPDFEQMDCQCTKLTDFVQAYYDDNGLTGSVYEPTTVIPSGDHADFSAELAELLADDEYSGAPLTPDFDLADAQSWLDSCEVGAGSFADTIMLAFQCDTVPDAGDTVSVSGFLDNCGEQMDAIANYNLFLAYNQRLADSAEKFIEEYKTGCFSGMDTRETCTMVYTLKEYHYTLYFYDQADNLIKTVPPAGVYQVNPENSGTVLHNSLISSTNLAPGGYNLDDVDDYRKGNSNNFVHPDHTMITNYKYNSLQKLVEQTTPDGGKTEFWYDALDRIVLSRNAIQDDLADDRFSYTWYDELGRVVESGEVQQTGNHTYTTVQTTARDLNVISNPTGSDLYDFIYGTGATSRTEVSHTFYDEPMNTTVDGYFPSGQEFLRTRIASVTYEELDDGNANTFDQASHYSYDIHGNVSILKQENNDLSDLEQDVKTITYEYDLISGNVNQVNYQAGKYDEFYHRYCYDADNRVTEVFTSRDGQLWERDEKQLYYAHGPLARKELGDRQVQACDHIYNAQGWLKAVNSSTGNEIHDAGADGIVNGTNNFFGRDANGFSLHYFGTDYTPVGTGANANVLAGLTNTNLAADGPDLYNGNISAMVTGLKDNNESALNVHANAYRYDQLNRIKEMNVYKYNTGTKPYDNATFDNTNSIDNDDYHTNYTFDGNGNVHSLQRYDNAATLKDNFDYHFYGATYATTKKTNNKLEYVVDAIAGTTFGDIASGQTSANYVYDAIGQLTDDVQECIDDILWDVRNKVLRIVRTGSCQVPGAAGGVYPSDVEFHYDALGQRTHKIEIPRNSSGVILGQKDWIYTYYVRDAQGNVMGVYKRTFTDNGSDYDDKLELMEHHIYGSDRCGLSTYNDRSVTGVFTATYTATDSYGSTIFTNTNYTTVPNDDVDHSVATNIYLYDRDVGNKQFELKNHLGSVLTIITDQRLPVDDLADGDIDWFTADIVSYSDYYPFGMIMPSRNAQSENYRYGFDGMEKDDEWQGSGNSYTTEFRMYDPRLFRWRSLDPLMDQFPHISAYAAYANNPIYFTDPYGLAPGGPGGEDNIGQNTYKTNESGEVLELGENVTIPFIENPEVGDLVLGSDQNEYLWGRDQEWTKIGPAVEVFKDTRSRFKRWWQDKFIPSLKAWGKKNDIVLEGGAKMTVGPQAKVKVGGVLKAEANIAAFELWSVKGDLTESNSWSGDYIGRDGYVVTQGVGLELKNPAKVGLFRDVGLGGYWEHKFRGHNGWYEDMDGNMWQSDHDYGVTVAVPLLKSARSNSISERINESSEAVMGSTNPGKLKFDHNAANNSTFNGLDIDMSWAFVIGLDIKIKIGVNTKK